MAENTHTCKFCEFTWDYDNPCDTSTYWVDDEGHGHVEESTCGNQACPACGSCQGNIVTSGLVRVAKRNREIFESRDKEG